MSNENRKQPQAIIPIGPRYLFLMLGFLGSGKSYVSRWLTPHVNAVYLRVDALRLAIFGEDRPELYEPENKALVNNASRYAIEQILQSGAANVVHDANHNLRAVRYDLAQLARRQQAQAITVWVDTPLDTAKKRTEERRITEGHELFEPNLVEKMAARLEPPHADEMVIIIDGLADQEAQKHSFDEQFARIQQRALQ